MYGNYYGGYYPQTTPADTLTQLRSQQAQPFMAQQPAPQPQGGNGLIWVQGEGGAKSYLVAPNTTIMLMDSEDTLFYLKSSDASGMPLPLRRFRYEEIPVEANGNNAGARVSDFPASGGKYVTHEELRAILADMAKDKREVTE